MNEVDWARFRAGDEYVFRELIGRYSPHLLSVIRAFAHNEDDESDLLQDTWVRIYTHRERCRSHESLLGWMLTVSRNICLAAGRSTRARLAREALFAEGESPISPMTSTVVHEMLAALPERQRDAVTFRIIEGRSTKETAQLLDCAEGTVKALLHQGLHALRRNIEGVRG